MADNVEEIKSKLDIVDIVRGYIPLQQAGSNFRAPCPFHKEKTPSFMVHGARQIWHCFGCGLGGDIFSFVMKQEGLEFGDALRFLAEKAGVQLHYQAPEAREEKNRALDLLDLASRYYHQALLKSPKAACARSYGESRGLDQHLIDEFRIGYSLPDGDALCTFLLSKKFTAHDILHAGLGFKKEQGYGLLDRFRNRFMIPIRNVHGAVVGFGGRILDVNEKMGKYINSPQTAYYDKSKIVFGLDKARNHIRAKGYVILVEGYMDFFALYQADVKHVAALSGTALTLDQIKLIKRFTNSMYFSLDMDSAGSIATLRALGLVLKEGVQAKVICLPRKPDGTPVYKDPDECMKKNPDDWFFAVQHAQSFIEFHVDRALTPHVKSDSFKKKQAVRELFDVIALLPDRIEQDHWIRTLAKELSLSERILWEEFTGRDRIMKKRVSGPDHPDAHTPPKNAKPDREDLFISILCKYPDLCEDITETVSECMFTKKDNAKVYTFLLSMYNKESLESEKGDFSSKIQRVLSGERLALLLLLVDNEYGEMGKDNLKKELRQLGVHIRSCWVHARREELKRLVSKAEANGDHEAVQRYMQEFRIL
jgi:DNA primase